MSTVSTTNSTTVVEYRKGFGLPWTTDANLFPDSIDAFLAPQISRGQMTRFNGYLDRTATPASAVVVPLDLRDYLIRITVTRATDTYEWYGVVSNQEDMTGNSIDVAYPIEAARGAITNVGIYHLTGLEYWLTQNTVEDAYQEAKNATFDDATLIHKPLPFNGRDKNGRIVSNRSADRNSTLGCYLFSDDVGNDPWTAWQVLEHLMVVFLKRYNLDYLFDDIVGQHESLEDYVDVWDPRGRTYSAFMQALIHPGYGWSWLVRGDTNTGLPVIRVMSQMDRDILDGSELVLPSNPLRLSLDLDGAYEIQDCRIRHPEDTRFHRIEVIGEPLRVIFTMAYSYDSMADHWTAAEVTAYNDLDPEEPLPDTLRHVFVRYKLPDDWDGLANGQEVLVQIDPADGSVKPQDLVANWARGQLRLDNTIPNLAAAGGGFAAINVEETPPIVICTFDGDLYRVDKPYPIDESGLRSSFRMLRDEVGLQLGCNPPHIYGTPDYAGTFDDDDLVEHEDIVATVALQTDERVRVVKRARFPEQGVPDRTKTIHVQGAGVWWAPKDTVIGFDGDALKLITPTDGYTFRDDTAILKRIANMAMEFYGRARSQVNCRYADGQVVDILGRVLENLTVNVAIESIGTIVSHVNFTFAGGQQTFAFETDYAQLDFRGIAMRQNYRLGGTVSARRLQAVADRLDQIPIAPAEDRPIRGGGGIPAKIKSGPTAGVYVGDLYANSPDESATTEDVDIKIVQIAVGEEVAANTWVLVTKIDDTYWGQPSIMV